MKKGVDGSGNSDNGIYEMDYSETRFSDNLLRFRLHKGWTQEVLAKRSKLRPAAISHFERGNRMPSLRNLCKLCNALDCSPSELVINPIGGVKVNGGA